MIIDRVFSLVKIVSNKEQRGDITPARFNVLAEMAQLEYMSKRVGNLNRISDRTGTPKFEFGYDANWRIHEDLRPMIAGPETIPLDGQGNFNYPYGYIWPDAVHKIDMTPIKRITQDQYPHIKRSAIIAPSSDYPVVIFRGQYGFVDPYQIGSISMSYLKVPPLPVWGYGVVNNEPVFDANLSTDFSVPPMAANEIALIILQHLGIYLSSAEISAFAASKESSGV